MRCATVTYLSLVLLHELSSRFMRALHFIVHLNKEINIFSLSTLPFSLTKRVFSREQANYGLANDKDILSLAHYLILRSAIIKLVSN
jgi:hypothetical protein